MSQKNGEEKIIEIQKLPEIAPVKIDPRKIWMKPPTYIPGEMDKYGIQEVIYCGERVISLSPVKGVVLGPYIERREKQYSS